MYYHTILQKIPRIPVSYLWGPISNIIYILVKSSCTNVNLTETHLQNIKVPIPKRCFQTAQGSTFQDGSFFLCHFFQQFTRFPRRKGVHVMFSYQKRQHFYGNWWIKRKKYHMTTSAIYLKSWPLNPSDLRTKVEIQSIVTSWVDVEKQIMTCCLNILGSTLEASNMPYPIRTHHANSKCLQR